MPEETPPTTPAEADPAAQQDDVTWDSLGMTPAEAAKAIAESQKWERRSKENFAKLKEAEPKLAEYEQFRAAQQTDAERQAEELSRAQTQAEQWRTTAVASRIEALAATDFADPSDAAAALPDASKYLDTGGVIDEAAIRADLTDLLARKPHWRRPEGSSGPRVPVPNPAQGSGVSGASANDPAALFGAIVRSQIGSG